MKPDWKDAPTWAMYLAMDSDGTWTFYEFEPVIVPGGFWWDHEAGRELDSGKANSTWLETLESRP